MSAPPQEPPPLAPVPRTTYCPFKAPARLRLPVGKQAAALRRFEQRPGMSLVHAHFPDAPSDTLLDWPRPPHLQIVYVAEGQLELQGESLPALQADAGRWLIAKPAGEAFRFQASPGCRAFWLEFDHQATESLTGFSDTVAPQIISLDQPFLSAGQASGRLLSLAQELASLQGDSTRERLLIESKTLEWLALLLDQPAFSPCRAIVPQRLSRDELALEAAARFLESRLHDDHSIAQLSRAVHLNEFKLKRGFRERFGNTVFGFLRQKRMEKARALIQSGRLSIIEVANAVGYSNPSHFARAFKQAFGVNPSELASSR